MHANSDNIKVNKKRKEIYKTLDFINLIRLLKKLNCAIIKYLFLRRFLTLKKQSIVLFIFALYGGFRGIFIENYFQSIIFYIFGINWATYIFHAALVNTILSLTSYYFFCQLGVKKILSF